MLNPDIRPLLLVLAFVVPVLTLVGVFLVLMIRSHRQPRMEPRSCPL